jgi:hypothetical protein
MSVLPSKHDLKVDSEHHNRILRNTGCSLRFKYPKCAEFAYINRPSFSVTYQVSPGAKMFVVFPWCVGQRNHTGCCHSVIWMCRLHVEGRIHWEWRRYNPEDKNPKTSFLRIIWKSQLCYDLLGDICRDDVCNVWVCLMWHSVATFVPFCSQQDSNRTELFSSECDKKF